MEKDIIVGIGEVLWDILPDGKKLGGAPCNFAYHIGQFGLDSRAVSAIGDDILGKEIVAGLEQKGIKYHIDTVPYPTGTVKVELDAKGVPQYEIKDNVAWDNIPFTNSLEALAKNTKAICFGSLAQRNIVSRNTINSFIDAVREHNDVLITFDINLRENFYTKEIICNSMQKCNILKINDEELELVSGLFGLPDVDFKEKCRIILREYNINILILTCGTDGSYIFTPDTVSFQKTPRVEVADTVGAGDSFTAAFVASILKGKSISEAHLTAVEVSAYVCTKKGAMPKLPERLTK